MAEIQNELTWSVSRAGLFQDCLRAYYYTYYGSWGGWSREAPERVRLLYLLKNMKTLPLWAGALVHETIREALESFARLGIRPELAALQEAAVQKLRIGWVESVTQAWLTQPKKTNLLELYYGDPENYGACRHLPKEVTDAVKQRVLDCMEGFYYSPIVKELLHTPVNRWQAIDTLDFFMVEGIKVWCAPDFAFRDGENLFHIIDWKTGGENRGAITQQLACYAMYARDKWGISLDTIRIHGVFLKDGGRVQNYEIQESSIDAVRQQIQESYQMMKNRLKDPVGNVAAEEDFPPRVSEGRCRNCPYRRVCLEG